MAQTTPCRLPQFASATEQSQRPMSLRISPNTGDDARLFSAFRENKLGAIIQATWGLILRCYMDSDEVCFGYRYLAAGDDTATKEVSPNVMTLTTVRLVIGDGDFARTLVEKAKGATVAGTPAVDEGRNALSDSHQLYNTVVLIRSSVGSSPGATVPSLPSALALTIPQECLLRLHVKVLRENVRIFLEWRNDGMSMEHVKGIATLFRNLLTRVLSPEDTPVRDLNFFTDVDLQRISAWNGPSPQVHDRCIHDIIREQVVRRPHDEAICAWDGSLSFKDFDQQASRLAYHLQAQGVGPEVLVPLCFDKSMWYFVALLAVLKAGGAFVPLDPSHPPARLQSLIKKVNAKLVLCSEWHADRLLGLAEIVIPLSQASFEKIPPAPVGFISSDEVNCTNAAYVIFTSGSTGEPKGTLLEHRAYCSSAMAHGPRLLIFPESRVLQFAAHTFDASLAESVSPFMHGACVCVPSEDDRLNDIVGAIKRLRANYASLTPSFIEFLDPSMVPEIQTLILAGEAMSETHRAKWSTINLVNGFGPTEASVTAAINSNVTATTDCRDIGLPLNTRCWIVNPDDQNQLVPVGAVGEMLLEGPTLARGYINNPEKTAEAFIYDPGFVRRASIPAQGRRRFYKTGDLVRYNSDMGSLTYIGRKDTQVKLHGQRVELGEIEGCLNAEDLVKHCVVFLPKEGYAAGKLTAVLSLNRTDEGQNETVPLGFLTSELHKESVTALRERLSRRLPTYMVPAVWVSVEDMPFLPSRKLDRKAILSWLARLDRDPYRTETTAKPFIPQEQPSDDVESQIVQVWSWLLNIPTQEIPLDESFLRLGGDSIAAMTCMNQCKKLGLAVTVQDILRSTSVRDLASHAQTTSTSPSASHEEKIDEPFDLSPIQALHFKVRQEGQGYFNQSIMTRLNRHVAASTLRQAVESLVRKHSMLRARFDKPGHDGAIRQRITNEVATSYRWAHHEVGSESEIDNFVATSQSSLSCFTGPILAVDLLDVAGDKQVLSMVAHHLVVDIVSWRVILEDLEEILASPSGSSNPATSLPFQTWLKLQAGHSRLLEQEQPELESLPAPDFAFWGLEKQNIIYGDVNCASFSLDERETSLLMAECHNSLRTEPVDLLLAAMLFSFSQTFSDRSLPVIYNEGHGREPWDASIDISRTVGWFTTLYPILIDQAKDAVDAVIRVKDRRRKVSDNGRSSFARRALPQMGASCAHDCPMEVNLNYLGQQRDLQRADGLFQLAEQMAGETREGGGSADFGRETPRFSLFEVSAAVVGGHLRFVFSFSASMRHQGRVQQWVQSCKRTLQSLADQLPNLQPRQTLSDVPLMALTYQELSLLETQKLPRYGVRSLDQVEDIYPCSKMQQGVLLSQARDPLLYAVSGTWEVEPAPGAPKPDIQKLVDAWNKVVDHHAMLRTVFATGLSRRHPFSHIVLKNYTSTPVLLQCPRDEDILATLESQPRADYRAIRPPHRITFCQSASGKVVCKLELSHAAMDGSSISLLLRDLQSAYAGTLNSARRPLFKEYIDYLQRRPASKGVEHWCKYLADLQPCRLASDVSSLPGRKSLRSIRLAFEKFSKLQSFCANNNITVANAFNGAWALTLAHLCQSDEVCFSYTASLRDAPVPGIDSVIGPAMNLLVCRLHTRSRNVVDIVRQIQDDYMENYSYRDVSLIDIQHAMKMSRTSLFNTGVSYRKLPAEDVTSPSIRFKGVGLIHDPAEISVYVNIEATDSDAQLELNYWDNWLSGAQAQKVADVFLQSLADIASAPISESSDPTAFGSQDIQQIRQWNSSDAQPPSGCIHAEIEALTAQTPHNVAIATESQELTYARLSDLSSGLANYLTNLGVLPGTTVPIAFEQHESVWAIISIIAIWKAGGSCIPLATGTVDQALETWMMEADLQVAVASPSQTLFLEEVAPYVIPVTDDLLNSLETDDLELHQPQLTDSAYTVFPADSSVGLVLDHNAIASSCLSFADFVSLDMTTRMLQCANFSSYEFLLEVFSTLNSGGCVCIPNNSNADNLSNAVSSLEATTIQMSHSLVTSVNLADARSLRQVILTGNTLPLRATQISIPHAQVYAFYGSAECSPACLRWSESDHTLTEKTPGAKTWVVDPSDHNTLLPVGGTGELVIESPGLARGYLLNTAAGAFVENPSWLSLVDTSEEKTVRRMFKTGVLVQYGQGGSLVYRGRDGRLIRTELVRKVEDRVSTAVVTDSDYWKGYLAEVEPCLFPSFGAESGEDEMTSLARLVIEDVDDLRGVCEQQDISPAAIFQLTWGVILRCYTGLLDVCYGFSESDQSGLLPFCLSLKDDRQINAVVREIEASMKHGAAHRLPLTEVLATYSKPESGLFNTVFYLNERRGSVAKRSSHMRGIGKDSYAVTVRAEMSKNTCVVEFLFLRDSLPETYADGITVCFEHVLGQVKAAVSNRSTIGDIDFLDEFTGALLGDWNSSLPERRERCVHELIEEQARRLPASSEAVCGWDGNFTYSQLEILATRLAQHLQRLGVGPETFVALCFNKSSWAIVAQLAVLKAGGAFASLDPAHPEGRLRSLVADLGAKVVLTSSACIDKASNLGAQPFVVSQSSIEQLPLSPRHTSSRKATPSNAAYAIFTSGTTGMPKATVLQHTALSTTSIQLAKYLGLDSTTRTLQFSSYTFDVSVLDIHGTLINGGCVCVPSDSERVNDLAGAIRRMGVTHWNSTPGIANTTDPKTIPSLATIVTGGEKMSPGHIERWSDRCVINAYGPSETSIIATVSIKVDRQGNFSKENRGSIGKPTCGRAWVVDPHNPQRLLPVGAVGELVLEGCNVARGYLNNEEKTAKVFIEHPKWSSHESLKETLSVQERMYRTGDLVRYNPEGTLTFISRMDTQIKLNGQRIELEEIEIQCLQALPEDSHVVVEIVAPKGKTVRSLAVFFCIPEYASESASRDLLLDATPSRSRMAAHIWKSIQDNLPQYMVPNLIFPVQQLPCNTSAKIDRRRLRAMAEGLPNDQLRPYTATVFNTVVAQKESETPQITSRSETPISTPVMSPPLSSSSISGVEGEPAPMGKATVESKLRQLWGEVLGVEPSSVNADDSFFGLGGDSFTAMSLVSAAQADGLTLSVAEIFQHSALSDMVKCCQATDVPTEESPSLPPFSLLAKGTDLDELLDEVANTCEVSKSSICDAYPCSALQEGLITASIQQPGAYVATPVFRLSQNIDIQAFKAAWQRTVDEIDILRSRILHTATANFVQVVLRPSPINWEQNASQVATRVGGPLTGYSITETGYSRSFTWSIHHSLYDGWSVPLVFQKVEENYELCRNGSVSSSSGSTVPYSLFIDHLQKRDLAASDDFWKIYLANMSSPAFPANKNSLPPNINASSRQNYTINVSPVRKDVTLPAFIRAAWAMILSLHTESGDVCFGETLMGRNINLPGATKITGPLLTTVPTRVAVDSSMKITDYLERVHQAAASMIPHQHAGLQQIRKLSEDTAVACDFQNLLVIQSAEREMNPGVWAPESTETNHEFFTYPLTVECRLANAVEVTAYFDDRVISSWRVQRLLGQFGVVLEQLATTTQSDDRCLSDVDMVSADDQRDLARWNRGPAPCVDRTIHDLINDQRLLRPEAPAVASWDGNLSYQDLFDTASAFASHLSSLGVGPEVLVPMCMDKSVWMIVTIMSILIAGGAFVPLDPAHPTSRHEEILEETGAKIVLCTPKYSSRYIGKVPTVLGVDQQTARQHQGRRGSLRKSATSANVAYSIFTSGSTGRPKGIIIEHRAFASSTMAYGPIIHLKPGVRVFQFASLTFDAAVMEILGTLIYGGCVCIPDDEERLNDVAGAIRRLDASWLFCTPSLASIMEPSSVPSLKVITCGGEMMSHEAMTKWSDKVHFINAYGPTETSVYATFNSEIGKNRNPANIGKTIPSTLAWIVDPDNYDRLYPVGVVGELALEGPVLAREYLKNPEKTKNAFISNPKWARPTRPGEPDRRIYLTGDLARFAADGSLEYVGRKDHQVKLHGQRMELGEIEYRLHEHQHVRHVVVILPKTGRLQKRLVSILSLNSLSTETSLITSGNCSLVDEEDMQRQGMAELLDVQSSLESQLPPYMVPQTWAVIKTLPMLVSGKIDRKKITAWVEGVDDATYNRIMGDYDKIKRGEIAAPKAIPEPKKDDTESVLRGVISRVLNIPADKVDMSRSFTSLGGDSITGMAIVSHARKQGITLSLHKILQAASIKELAKEAGTGVTKVSQTENSNAWFDLSAIQKFYFKYATQFKGSARFNQSISLRLPHYVEPSVIENGLKAVASKHAMLRARFRQSNGKWEQMIMAPGTQTYRFQVTTLQEQNDLNRMVAVTQNTIDIQDGPAFAANLFEVPGVDQILFLVASHLCIDMVSWRLILQDLEEFVKTGSLATERPLPFQSWCAMQIEHCKAGDYQSHLPFNVVPSNPAYWGMKNVPNEYGDIRIKKFSFSTKETSLALDKCHARLRTEPLDLFLAVVLHSFRRTFTDRQLPTVYNETHGRQAWDSSMDLSGTVGWFTSICPLHVQPGSDDILETLRMVKDARRKTVNNGTSFFAQQILHPENQHGSPSMALPVEIVFNYLGKLQQLEREDSTFQHYGNAYDENDFMVAGDMGPKTPRFALFEISAIVIQNQLQFSFTFNKNMRHQAQISSWISECEMTLYEALDILQQRSQLEVMPSDYPLLSISQSNLETLFNSTLPKLGVHSRDEVEDIYPCSPMQEGIMFSQLRDPSAYMLHTIFNVRDNRDNRPINVPRLRKAWQMVVNRHSILRTIFIDSNSKNGSFDQVILKHLHADLVELECDDSNALEQLNKVTLEETNRKRSSKQLYQLTVCKLSNGTAVMKMEMNHAIVDGASVGILLRDFSLAYERQLPTEPGPLYRNYIAHMRAHPMKEGIAFWTEYLRGTRPCHLPASGYGARELKSVKMDFHRFAELRQLGQKQSVTVANLVLAAWALVLREFTGSQDVCFGYLSAGRDVPVAGIQDAIGIFINMLCCRVQFSNNQSFADIYKSVQDDFFRSIPYQTCSLATVQNELGLGSQMLFNSALSIQNKVPSAGSKGDALSFDIQKAYDPSEFPVTVNVVTAQGGEGILLRYWSDVISTDQANRLVAGIAKVFISFIEGSSSTISTLQQFNPSVPLEQQDDQLRSRISLRRRSSVRSRSSRLSINDPLIQQQIDQRVNEILSQVLKKDELATIRATEGLSVPNDDAKSFVSGKETLEPPISPISRMTSIRRRFSTMSRASRRRMSMDLERKLLLLWSVALDVPADMVDRQDSFFRVGGDSIKAMKMASAAREEGLVLTVADVFRNPVFDDMLAVICSTNIVHTAPAAPKEPIEEEDDIQAQQVDETVEEIIPSGTVSRQSLILVKNSEVESDVLQADICPKIGFFKGGISDVLPVTDFQALSLTAQLFESRWMLNYFYLDGEGQFDLKRLRESCARVMDAFDILRTVFVCSGDHFYQVILKKARPAIVIYETHTDLDTFTASLQQRDRDQGLRQGEQFVQFVVAKRKGTNQQRLLIRLSHAQYDGMCISKILDAIKQGYEGGTLPPTMSYANYMRLLPSSITPDHYEYWTKLLKGSRMTDVVCRDYPNTYQTMGAYAEVKTTINISQNSTIGNITVGTLVQAAWALALAKLAADDDVVFGLTVNGRNASIPGVQDTVGPCLNMIPVRVTIRDKWTGLDLIRYLQDQLVASMPYESLGFREIIQRCTDWPCSTYFSTAVLHQNVDYEGQIDLDNHQYRVGGAGVIDNLADFTIVSRSVGSNQVSLSLGYSGRGPITEALASRVLQLVCDTIITLTSNPMAPLPSPNTLRSLPPQTIPDLPRVSDQELLTSQLKSQNISDILVHSAILSRTWQQVLPSMYSNQKTFQLDTSFYDLGGDLFALGQATWLLQQEGYQIRIEDLLDRPTFLGHMAVLARDTLGESIQDDAGNAPQEEGLAPVGKSEKKVRWKKAFGLMGKFSKRDSVSS
ncbi:nonribosomal peptide synthase Pes1 [Aspergillus lucknowensis]|uniref:Carrier domain-containing protein n=1 Tax=Aspergillus lucknowensis TaxID=176173 RepID=A0ABR4M554_9EURO